MIVLIGDLRAGSYREAMKPNKLSVRSKEYYEQGI